MSLDQETHLKFIQAEVSKLLDSKYRRGADEHQSNLFDMPTLQLVDESINEAIDQLTYLLTLRDRLAIKH